MSEQYKKVRIFTDGACRGNPGRGGWGVVLRYEHHVEKLYGGEHQTTNNRMELTAAIRGLATLTHPADVEITTDSQYVKNGITEWLAKWKQNGWRTTSRKPVKNIDLWQELDRLVATQHSVQWFWVRGHSGHPENETADLLANLAIDELR